MTLDKEEMLMSKITRYGIEKDLAWLKSISKAYIRRGKFERALNTIQIAADLLYQTNVVHSDDDLETMMKEISGLCFGTKNNLVQTRNSNNDRKVVFYDLFSIDNRGLTEQYLEGLIRNNYQILYLGYKSNKTGRSDNIFRQLSGYSGAEVRLIDKGKFVDMASELRNHVIEYNPSAGLIHTSPSDVSGILAFCSLRNFFCRYLINITDHAFWLGKCSADKFIEFRSYGFNISKNLRKIDSEQLVILPYYPIQAAVPFQGFPFDYEANKVIFSGGSLYKIYGDDFFFSVIKHIVSKHDNVVFLYMGNGDPKIIKSFIAKNRLEKRVYYLKERKDISEVFKRIWFYIDTFPIGGGLMTQLAIANKKVPVSYRRPDQLSNTEQFLLKKPSFKITFEDKTEFLKELDLLITDPMYLKSHEEKLNDLVIDKTAFSEQLDSILQNGETTFQQTYCKIDPNEFFRESMRLLERDPSKYYMIFLKRHSLRAWIYAERKNPGVFLKKITEISRRKRNRSH